jgi:hypothetical protein
MQTLRRARHLARLVLGGFVLALGVAMASPLVQPQAMDLVCTVDGSVKLVVHDSDDGQAQGRHALDCPACLQVAAPPARFVFLVGHDTPLSFTPRFAAGLHAITRAAAPLPPRGPPALA